MTAAIAPSTFSALPLAEGLALLNLLIVDDERAVREACREAATALGYRTTAAESAEHALRVIDAHNIDVVLLDLRLPGVGGLEVLRQLKKARPDIEIVVVTGHGTVESVVQAMKAGAYDYMTKPFSLEELRLLLARGASHLKLKTEIVCCARRSGLDKVSAASSAGHRKWISSIGSLPRPPTAFTRH